MRLANIGTIDRILRIIIGAILIASAFFIGPAHSPSTFGVISIIIGCILMLTAFIRFCPIYSILGLRTRPKP